MRVPSRLQPLVDDGIVDEVLRPLMSGKEAEVFLVRSDGELRVADGLATVVVRNRIAQAPARLFADDGVLRKERPETRIVLSEPANAQLIASGTAQERTADGGPASSHPSFQPHPIQGWTPDFIPNVLQEAIDNRGYDELVPVAGAAGMDWARKLARREGIRWLVTTSRRTGKEVEAKLRGLLPPEVVADAVWWCHLPEKKFPAYLGAAEVIWVTQDSVSMVTEAVAAGKPVVVIAMAGRPLALTGVMAADALIWTGHPGSEGGHAIADVLFGDKPPSGRLACTSAGNSRRMASSITSPTTRIRALPVS